MATPEEPEAADSSVPACLVDVPVTGTSSVATLAEPRAAVLSVGGSSATTLSPACCWGLGDSSILMLVHVRASISLLSRGSLVDVTVQRADLAPLATGGTHYPLMGFS